MEYVRESWNSHQTPENLIESLKNQNDNEFNKNVAKALLNLNSEPKVSTPLFLDYLKILFINYPDIFLEILSSESCKEFGLGFINLINHMGFQFINFLNVGDQKSAQCIINILNFSLFLTPEDICMNALKKLSVGLKFSALVASSRVFFEKEIHDLRPIIQEKFFPDSFVPYNLMMSQFKRSIFNDSITCESNYQKHSLVSLIFWNLIITHQNTFLSKYLTKRSLILLFVHIVSTYVNNPSLSLAYILFYTFPNILNENINQIIEDVKQIENEDEEADESNGLLKSDVIEKLLTTEQFSEPQPPELIKSVLLCPKSITTFSDKLFEITSYDQIKKLNDITPPLMQSSTDVITYLALQNQLSTFLLKLAQVCENSQDDPEFCQIWYLFLHYVQSSWSQGSATIREMVNSIMNKVTSGTRFFLTVLLTYKKPDFELSLQDSTSHYQRSIILYDKLMKNTVVEKFFRIVEKSEKAPHFWPSIILYCICQPYSVYLRILSSVKLPDTPLINALFTHFMYIVIVNDQQVSERLSKPVYISTLKYPDFGMMVRYPAIDSCELKTIIKDHISLFMTSPSLSPTVFNQIACLWRSWLEIYDVKKFTLIVFDCLNVLTVTISVLFDPTIILEKLALMFGCICENDLKKGKTRTDIFSEVLDTIFENFNEERFQNKDLAYGMGSFCITLISLVDQDDGFDTLFNKTFDFAKFCLKHHPLSGESKSTENERYKITSAFAMSFINKALHTPVFQNKIVDAPFDYLEKIKDWKTLTDFFIVKAKIK